MDVDDDDQIRNKVIRFYYFSAIVDLITDSISNYGVFESPALKLPIVQGDLLCKKSFLNCGKNFSCYFFFISVRIGRVEVRNKTRAEIVSLLPKRVDKLITLDVLKFPYDQELRLPGVSYHMT